MRLEFRDTEFIDNCRLNGKIDFSTERASLLFGDNGVGKSSLLQYIKLHQNEVLGSITCCFIEQNRLNPLNDISFNQLLDQMREHQYTGNQIFEQFSSLAKPYADKPIRNLSGGQNQMVKILLALFLDGEAFFFDEPLQNLDQANAYQIKSIICELLGQKKFCFLVEHNRHLMEELKGKLYELKREGEQIRIISHA